MSEATNSSVKFLFVPVFIPVFIPVPMATLNSPLGEKQQHVQQQQHGTIQPDHGSPLACTHFTGEEEKSFELSTLTSSNPKLCFGHYPGEGLEGRGGETRLFPDEEHCVKRGFKEQYPGLATFSSGVTTSVLDTLPLVSNPQHFFSKEQNSSVQFLSLSYLYSLASYIRYSSLRGSTEIDFEMGLSTTKLSTTTCSSLGLPNSPNPNPMATPPRPNPRGANKTVATTSSSSSCSSCSSCLFGRLCYFDRSDCCMDSWLLVSFPPTPSPSPPFGLVVTCWQNYLIYCISKNLN